MGGPKAITLEIKIDGQWRVFYESEDAEKIRYIERIMQWLEVPHLSYGGGIHERRRKNDDK